MTAQRGPHPPGKRFNDDRTKLLTDVKEVLEEYSSLLPLSVRSICYVLVGKGKLEKSEKAFTFAASAMTEARRAIHHDLNIPMDALSGDDITEDGGSGYDAPYTPAEYASGKLRGLPVHLQNLYRRPKLVGQQTEIFLWCEAKGMFPQIERAAHPYGIHVASGSGMVALRAWHRLGTEAAQRQKENMEDDDCPAMTAILWVGDLDLPGVKIFNMAVEDSRGWCEDADGDPDMILAERVAVTPEQVDVYGLEFSAEVKHHTQAKAQIENMRRLSPAEADWLLDGATFDGRESAIDAVQAEAMNPADRGTVIREAIERYLDMDVYRENKARGRREYQEAGKLLSGANDRLGEFVTAELRRLTS